MTTPEVYEGTSFIKHRWLGPRHAGPYRPRHLRASEPSSGNLAAVALLFVGVFFAFIV